MRNNKIVLFAAITGCIFGAFSMASRLEKKIQTVQEMNEKHLILYRFMTQWVQAKQEGKSLINYFIKNGYHSIAIYGMNFVGETLLNELKNTDIQVEYGIDRDVEKMNLSIRIITPEDEMDKVDAIVVTPIIYFESIETMLKKKIVCPVVSIEDVLYEC